MKLVPAHDRFHYNIIHSCPLDQKWFRLLHIGRDASDDVTIWEIMCKRCDGSVLYERCFCVTQDPWSPSIV